MGEIASAAIAAVELGLKLLPLLNSQLSPTLDTARIEMNMMQAFLRDTKGGGSGDDEWSRNQVLQIRDLAYDIEDIVEKYLMETPQNLHHHRVTKVLHHLAHPLVDLGANFRLSSAIKEIEAKIRNILQLNTMLGHSNDPPHIASGSGLQWPSSPMAYMVLREDELVGIDKRASALARAILEGESHLAVVSVFGPQGSGKTTILKEMFKRLKGTFECCVWINVQGASSSESMLEMVVAAAGGSRSVPRKMHAEDSLVHLLQKKRYALFFDGISRKADFGEVMSLLPDDLKGSRVIISTHKQDVAMYCARPSSNMHEIESLTSEESLRLLSKIAFCGGQCPEHLVEWTEKLLKKCERLPAAVVVAMGRVLSTRHQSPGEFMKLHDNLGHEIGGNAGLSVVGKILLPSYYHLSHNKKCCFLSFSNFPEDYSVTRGRLIRLWIAERFIVEAKGSTQEEVAEVYLNELIQMGLVIVSKWDSEGNAKSCRVQNLVLEFILSRSDKEKFCSVLPRSSNAFEEKIRRMSVQGVVTDSFLTGHDLFRVRSLMTFTSESLPSKSLDRFSLLRILDFENANLLNFPEEIVKLGLLRHLSLRNTEVKAIPKSIGKLESLVTLDLRQTLITNLPKEISKLQQLVYLLITHKYYSQEGAEVISDITQLVSLQKLSLVTSKRNNTNSFAKELKSMTELRKLGISRLTRDDGKALCESLGGMRKLSSLQVISASQQEEELVDLDSLGSVIPCPIRSLYLAGCLPCWVSSLSSLAKLRLRWSRMRSSQLEAIQGLPNLVELKLSEDAYTEYELVVKAGWFGNLKILELEDLSLLETVEVRRGAMPQLTRLVIRGCQRVTVCRGVENLRKLEELLILDIRSTCPA